jgi:hypothetical protein
MQCNGENVREPRCENSIFSAQEIENVSHFTLLTLMFSLVFEGESFAIPMVPLITN